MDISSILLIALGLAMDVFAVSLGVGTSRLELPGAVDFAWPITSGFFREA